VAIPAEQVRGLINSEVILRCRRPIGDAAHVLGSGWRRAAEVGKGLAAAGVKQLNVLELCQAWPECSEKGDASDWIGAGVTAEMF
jgi:hypothetical protein